MNPNSVYVVSLRRENLVPAQGCVMELEDVFVETMPATLVAPRGQAEFDALARELRGRRATLFMAVITLSEMVGVLRRLGDAVEHAESIVVYLFDSFLSEEALRRSWWRHRVSRQRRLMTKVSRIFVPIKQEMARLADHCATEISYMPMAADVQRFGTDNARRFIDVNAYGRQNFEHVHALADRYNQRDSGRMLHYTNHMSIARVGDLPRHRAVFWKLLAASRIALAYDPFRTNPDGRNFPGSFVGQRWYESLAAGCVILGKRPLCAESDELLDWVDATLESPEDTSAFVSLVEELLEDPARIAQIRSRNVGQMRLRHDWGHRILAMSEIAGLSPGPALRQRLDDLRSLTPLAS